MRGARPSWLALSVALVATVLPAVPATGEVARKTKNPNPPIAGAHDCIPRDKAEQGDAEVPWKDLKNPVFELDDATKDQALRLIDGAWHLFYSDRSPDGSAAVGHAVSTDLRDWQPERLFEGMGSPDITRAADDRYVITAQQRDPVNEEISRIHYRAAPDVEGVWTEAKRLAPGLYEDQRTIDAGLAHTSQGLFLLFKRGLHTSSEQHDELVWSPSGSLDGPWEYLGEPDLPWSENFQFLVIGGKWHVLVTTIPIHTPTLFRIVGDPSKPESWLHWKKVRTFKVPEEEWNTGKGAAGITHEVANSAYLCDARRLDGYWYLVYSGSTELTTFDGRGHGTIGISRSKDLKRWEAPPD